jgi:hypothetical protein
MSAVQQAGVIGLGEALAAVLAVPAVQVGAVDQPGPPGCAGLGGDERGQRDALAALGGHPHHRGEAVALPGAALGRPQALAGLVFGAEPGAQIRRRPLITGQVSCFHAAMASSSARRPGGPGPARSTRSGAAAHPARPVCSPPRTARAPARRSGPASSTGPATPRRSAGIQHRLQLAQLRRGQLAPGPARALGGQRLRPPVASPAAAGSPTSAIPGSVSRPPGRWRRPRSAPPRPAAPARGGPVLRWSARRHRGYLMVRA